MFFSRCRPQEADAADLAVKERRVFAGSPAWRPGGPRDRHRLRESIVDLRCPDDEWYALKPDFSPPSKQYQSNRNLAWEVEPGAIALVPRADRGVIYAGRVTAPFTLVDDPPWADDYLQLRIDQGLHVNDEIWLLGDIAQCWEVDRFRSVPFPLVPAWIRRSLFGRSTLGRIKPLEELDLDPFPVLDRLLDDPRHAVPTWTIDPDVVWRRLVEAVGPGTFEHLVVALLQLEHADQIWAHVGGSGDGGVDGIGADERGDVVGILQCKLAYWGAEVLPAAREEHKGVRRILASLIHGGERHEPEGAEFWDGDRVTKLVVKHADRLPLALTLRVGTGH